MYVWAYWNFQTFHPMINHLCTRLEEPFNEVVNGPIVSKKQTNNKMKQHKIKGKTLRFHTLPRGLNKKKRVLRARKNNYINEKRKNSNTIPYISIIKNIYLSSYNGILTLLYNEWHKYLFFQLAVITNTTRFGCYNKLLFYNPIQHLTETWQRLSFVFTISQIGLFR